jgi:hypothetical protein
MPAVGSSSSIISGSSASVVAISSSRIREFRQADGGNEFAGASVELRQLRFGPPEIHRMSLFALQRDADVFMYGQVRKHRRNLERAHQARARDGRRP